MSIVGASEVWITVTITDAAGQQQLIAAPADEISYSVRRAITHERIDPGNPWSPQIEYGRDGWQVSVPVPVTPGEAPWLPEAPELVPDFEIRLIATALVSRAAALEIAGEWLSRLGAGRA